MWVSMKRGIRIVCSLLLALCLYSCVTQHSGLTHNSLQYIERHFRDSIAVYDSVFIKETPDTVYEIRRSILFRDRVRVDTIFVTDTLYREQKISESLLDSTVKGNGGGRLLGLFVALFVALVLWRCGIFDLVSHIVKMFIKS